MTWTILQSGCWSSSGWWSGGSSWSRSGWRGWSSEVREEQRWRAWRRRRRRNTELVRPWARRSAAWSAGCGRTDEPEPVSAPAAEWESSRSWWGRPGGRAGWTLGSGRKCDITTLTDLNNAAGPASFTSAVIVPVLKKLIYLTKLIFYLLLFLHVTDLKCRLFCPWRRRVSATRKNYMLNSYFNCSSQWNVAFRFLPSFWENS